MQPLLTLFVALLPVYSLGFYFGLKFLSLSHVIAGAIAGLFVTQWAVRQREVRTDQVQPFYSFLLFLVAALVGILISPYGAAVYSKGFIQITGILCMLFVVVALDQEIERTPSFFLRLITVSIWSLGIFGAIGVFQFIFNSVPQFRSLRGYGFFNSNVGTYLFGRGDFLGDLHRARSLASEPSHFARFLGAGIGIALLRVGALGKDLSHSFSKRVPLWAAWCIISGTLVSMSILGWTLFLLIWGILLIFLLLKRIKFTALNMPAVGIILGMVFLGHFSWSDLRSKMESLSALVDRKMLDRSPPVVNPLPAATPKLSKPVPIAAENKKRPSIQAAIAPVPKATTSHVPEQSPPTMINTTPATPAVEPPKFVTVPVSAPAPTTQKEIAPLEIKPIVKPPISSATQPIKNNPSQIAQPSVVNQTTEEKKSVESPKPSPKTLPAASAKKEATLSAAKPVAEASVSAAPKIIKSAPVPAPPPPPIVAIPEKNLRERFIEHLTRSMDAYLKEKNYYSYSLSTFTIGTNMIVAINNFFRHPLLGGGIGSHPLAHKIYAPDYGPASRLNADDAASLFLRLLSETGILGTFLFIFPLVRIHYRAFVAVAWHRRIVEGNSEETLAAFGLLAASLGLVIIYLLRNGFYYEPSFWCTFGMVSSFSRLMRFKNTLPNENKKFR